jgi:ribonuclease P protein component
VAEAGNQGASFPKSHRLLTSADFRRVLGERRRVASRYGSFHVRRNGLDHARLGVTVSRKVSRKAVQRNRIKRLVREYFRRHSTAMDGTDLVFTAFPPCAELDNRALEAALESLWERSRSKCAQ